MKFQRGTPFYGLLLGLVCVAVGCLLLTIGFWKTLLLTVLFAVGFFLGSVENKSEFIKKKVNRIVPDRDPEIVNFRNEVIRDQANKDTVANEKDPEE